MRMALGTAWEAGRLDAGRGPPRVLFGRMYEDPAIERAAFSPGGRVFCIASAGCTAMHLSPYHDIVAVDINPMQLAYAKSRIEGAPMVRGTAEHVMRIGRALLPLAGWRRTTLDAFLDFDDPAAQRRFGRPISTRDGSVPVSTRCCRLRRYARRTRRTCSPRFQVTLARSCGPGWSAASASTPIAAIPSHMRFSPASSWPTPVPPEARRVELVQSDAATYLEQAPPQSFRGFTLSNILDGADDSYRARLFRAIRRAAASDAGSC